MSPPIIIEEHGPVLHVINHNPDTRNSLTLEYITGLHDLLCDVRHRADSKIRAIVLSGADGFFCSGGDMSGLSERAQGHYAARRSLVDKLNDLVRAVRVCPCPVLAAVEGGAAGAGAAIALSCDMIFSGKSAFLAASYVKIGLTPDAGTSVFLSAGLPRWLVAELLFTGQKISAQRLFEMGVVNHLIADGTVVQSALDSAQKLAQGPYMAICRTKMLLAQAATQSFDAQLESEADILAKSLGSPEAQEGITAFMEKRAPKFS